MVQTTACLGVIGSLPSAREIFAVSLSARGRNSLFAFLLPTQTDPAGVQTPAGESLRCTSLKQLGFLWEREL